MTFPVSLTGAIDVPSQGMTAQSRDRVELAISDWLVASKATQVTVSAEGVKFVAGLFRFVLNTNILVPFNSGTISVMAQPQTLRVEYTLSCRLMLAVTSAIAAFTGVFVVAFAIKDGAWFVLVVPVIMWTWLFGMNYLLGWARIRFALKQVAQQALKKR